MENGSRKTLTRALGRFFTDMAMETNQNNEPTTSDILETINELTTHIDERLNGTEGRFSAVVTKDYLDERLSGIEGRLDKVEGTMVTKEYLDDKLIDLKSDLTVVMRKEDTKLKAFVEIAHKKEVLNDAERQQILGMDPFPQNP
ncbi:MAG: hypothetical protein Q7S89_00080 [bacterium]|nr:hypothetical protein [bacterium]